jgi:2-dehydro-3-deoxygluconokinase
MSEKLDIITIGESLIELSSDKSLKYAEILTKYYGGDTLCSAVAAARLGSKVGYITRVGNDRFKEFLLESWQLEGLDISQVKLVDGFNGIYFIATPADAEKEFSFYRRKTAATKLSVDDINPEYIKSAPIIYSSGITQSLSISAKEAVKKAFVIAKENNLITAFDPAFDPCLWSVEEAREAIEDITDYADIFFLNIKQDSEKLYGINSHEKVIKYLMDKGVGTVVVKSFEYKGYFIGYAGDITFIDYFPGEVVDTTGAGYSFNGAFLHALNSGMSAIESAKMASVVAGLQCKGIGAVKSIPNKEQVFSEFYG